MWGVADVCRFATSYPKHNVYKVFAVNFVLGINYGEVVPSAMNPALMLSIAAAAALGLVIFWNLLCTIVGRRRQSIIRRRSKLSCSSTMTLSTAATPTMARADGFEVPSISDTSNPYFIDTFQNPLYGHELTDQAYAAASPAEPPAATDGPFQAPQVDPLSSSDPLANLPYLHVYQTIPKEPEPSAFARGYARVFGVLELRLGLLGMSVGDATLLLVIVGVNVLCLLLSESINELGLPTNMGYLAIGNGLLVVVPATRNSVLATLVRPSPGTFPHKCSLLIFPTRCSPQAGIPFDRAVAFHRFMGYVVFVCVSLHMVLFWAKV